METTKPVVFKLWSPDHQHHLELVRKAKESILLGDHAGAAQDHW